MTRNVGTIDRAIRIFLAVVVIVLYLTGVISGIVALILGIVAVAFLLSSLVGYCPLYAPLGITTRKKE